jgi:hypothetical protein
MRGSISQKSPPLSTSPRESDASAHPGELSRDEYRLVQYHFVELFVGHLLDASKGFGGDLTELVVMATVGQAHIRGDELGREHGPINATRISDVTGIPRQTVRRKLESLQKRGWVQQIDGGGWQVVIEESEAVARRDLAELDRSGIKRALKMIRATAALAKR